VSRTGGSSLSPDATCFKDYRDRHSVSLAVNFAVRVKTDGREKALGIMADHSETGPF
jgi:hypothetical protein